MAPQRPQAQLRPVFSIPQYNNIKRSTSGVGKARRIVVMPRLNPSKDSASRKIRIIKPIKHVKPTKIVVKKPAQNQSTTGAGTGPKPDRRAEKISVFRRSGRTIIRIYKVPSEGEKAEDMLSTLELGEETDATK
ncbi:hypothetical protein GE09DRAFT_1219104 [Coniochaeta sp. 2T2.1]|nr:hypothetical protein GE09DRAFT_1219104 [Coniochaeta sp. 2T2.1]